ncbi:hypothetical protein ACFFUR_07500, partial [Echinicola jeungdonensis]
RWYWSYIRESRSPPPFIQPTALAVGFFCFRTGRWEPGPGHRRPKQGNGTEGPELRQKYMLASSNNKFWIKI